MSIFRFAWAGRTLALSNHTYDVVIVGGGPIGAALAIALQGSGLALCWCSKRGPTLATATMRGPWPCPMAAA